MLRLPSPLALRAALLPCGAALLCSCGGDGATSPGSSPPEEEASRVASLEVSPAFDSLAAGVELTLTAVARDDAGAQVETPVQWSSSDTLVLTVTGAGIVRGVGFGEATVTARAGAASGEAAFRVVERARRDRVDESLDASVHFLYAARRDLDRSLSDACDLALSVERSLQVLGAWLGRLSNLTLRVDRWTGPFARGCLVRAPDLSVVSLDTLGGPPYELTDLLRTVREAGFDDPGKIYVTLVEGREAELRCGAALGRHAFVYLRYTDLTGRRCGNLPMEAPSRGGDLGATELVVMHEILHLLGAVHTGGPNSDGARHVTDFEWDVMYALGPDLTRAVPDVNCDDYYGHPPRGDVADSPFLRRVTPFLPSRCSKVLPPRSVTPGGFGDPID